MESTAQKQSSVASERMIIAHPLPPRPTPCRSVLDAAAARDTAAPPRVGTVLDAAKRHPKFQERTDK